MRERLRSAERPAWPPKLKIRQPLLKVEVVLAGQPHQAWLAPNMRPLLREELNVKQVDLLHRSGRSVHLLHGAAGSEVDSVRGWASVPPALKVDVGFSRRAKVAVLLAEMESKKQVMLQLPRRPGDARQRRRGKRACKRSLGWAAAQGHAGVVVLSTEITPDLHREGIARELIHAIQTRRRDMDCKYTDRIRVGILTDSADVREAVEQFADMIRGETLATELLLATIDAAEPQELSLGDDIVQLHVAVV